MELPAYLKTSLAPRLVDQLPSAGGIAQPFLSIQGNRFTLVDSTGDTEPVTTSDPKTGMPYLDAVVIDGLEVLSRVYYGKPFDPNDPNPAPPACWSDNGIAPSRNASTPQSPTCAACPKAEWGSKVSAVSGKGVPACSTQQKLALLIPGDEVQFLLRIPPNSLKNWEGYKTKFKGQVFDVKDVLTRISFAKEGIGTLLFSAVKVIDQPTAQERETAYAKKGLDALVGRGDQPRGELSSFGLPRAASAISSAGPAAIPAPTPTAAPVASTTNVPVNEPARRPGRPRRNAAAQEAAGAPTPPPPTAGQAPFREAPGPNGGAQHGIQAGVEPNAEIKGALDTLFGP